MAQCAHESCLEPGTIEAIAPLDGWGLEETVILHLCERHASEMGEDVVVVETPADRPDSDRDI